jgi:hypothetical protein
MRSFFRRFLYLVIIIVIIGLNLSCNRTTYETICTKNDVEIIFKYTDKEVLSYKATNDDGILVEKEILGDIDWMEAIIDTAEEFGGVCTIKTNE